MSRDKQVLMGFNGLKTYPNNITPSQAREGGIEKRDLAEDEKMRKRRSD